MADIDEGAHDARTTVEDDRFASPVGAGSKVDVDRALLGGVITITGVGR